MSPPRVALECIQVSVRAEQFPCRIMIESFGVCNSYSTRYFQHRGVDIVKSKVDVVEDLSDLTSALSPCETPESGWSWALTELFERGAACNIFKASSPERFLALEPLLSQNYSSLNRSELRKAASVMATSHCRLAVDKKTRLV